MQDPLINNISGTYQLIVTEKRNGCSDTVASNLNMVVLASGVVLKSESVNNTIVLRWSMTDKQTSSFEIERSRDGAAFEKIGSVSAGQNNIELPVSGIKDKLNIVAVYINNQLQFSGKVVF